jgi:hypothetical protein
LRPTGKPSVVRDLIGVSGPQNPFFLGPFGSRNGSETARGTAEFRPRPRPALFVQMTTNRGGLLVRWTRHRGGRAQPVPGCPEGRFISRVRLGRRPSRNQPHGVLSEMRSRPARQFLGKMTPPRRPGESPLQFLGGISPSKFYFTGQHSPTIKTRAPARPLFTGDN